MSTVRNLTERDQIKEAELRTRKAESLVLMAGGIAHDFNNLFQALQGNLEVAGMRAQGNPFLTEPLNRALGALNRAVSLSWKMLDFSGHGLVQPLQLSLEGWLPAYVETLRLEFLPTFHLQLACEPAPPIKGDRSKLEQVLKAILGNALEAAGTSASQVRLRLFVDFGADRPGPESPGVWPLRRPQVPATVCLEIADDGPGVPPEQLDLICDPFYTTREPGRGLGLAAAVGILTAHRAGLHIFNGEGGGLTLRLHFPPGGA
jgi:signal transduction histidine kinase